MKKLIIFILFVLTSFALYSCANPINNSTKTDKTDVKNIVFYEPVSALSVSADNDESFDVNSEHGIASVSSDVKKSLGLSDGDIVFKLYNCPVIHAFGKADSIEDVFTGDDVLQNVYAVLKKDSVANDEWRFYLEADKTLIETSDAVLGSISKELSVLAEDTVLERIEQAVNVKNKYFFFNPTMCQGTAIYYETDGGDFVYYNFSDTGEYLFTKNKFFEVMKEVYAQMGPTTPPGGIDIFSVCDLTAFEHSYFA